MAFHKWFCYVDYLPVFLIFNSKTFKLFSVVAETFELGTERTFSLISDVALYDLKTVDLPIGYRISGAIKVGVIWGNDDSGFLLRFEVRF